MNKIHAIIFLRIVFAIALFLFSLNAVSAQDGSNITYVKPSQLNKSQLGKFVHLDFGKRSFGREDRSLDTVKIKLNNQDIILIEHRVDDGYNNWFKDQYLESIKTIDGLKLRITKSRLLAFKGGSIRLKSYFDFFDDNENLIAGKSFTKELEFKKNLIAEVLVKNN